MASRSKVFTTAFVVLVVLLFVSSIFFDSVYTTMITTAVAIFGGLAIYYQIYKESKIAEGEFLHSLDQSFKEQKVWDVATRLFDVEDELVDGRFVLKRPFEKEDCVDLMAYLTFFETLYLLIMQNVVTMEEVDQLFRRRFFKAVMNESVQRHELVKHYYGYVNIYLFNEKWLDYLDKMGADQKSSVQKHGVPLEDAHEEYWKCLQNKAQLKALEDSGEKVCMSYGEVLDLGDKPEVTARLKSFSKKTCDRLMEAWSRIGDREG